MTNQANNTAPVSATTEALVTEAVATVTAAVKAPSKADRARALFDKMAGSARKDVIKAFQDEIGLSAAASATYYQNIKSKLKTPAATEPAAVVEPAAESQPVTDEAQDPVAEPVAEAADPAPEQEAA